MKTNFGNQTQSQTDSGFGKVKVGTPISCVGGKYSNSLGGGIYG